MAPEENVYIPEEKLSEVCHVLRKGLRASFSDVDQVSQETREAIQQWCIEIEEYIASKELEVLEIAITENLVSALEDLNEVMNDDDLGLGTDEGDNAVNALINEIEKLIHYVKHGR